MICGMSSILAAKHAAENAAAAASSAIRIRPVRAGISVKPLFCMAAKMPSALSALRNRSETIMCGKCRILIFGCDGDLSTHALRIIDASSARVPRYLAVSRSWSATIFGTFSFASAAAYGLPEKTPKFPKWERNPYVIFRFWC